MASSRTVCCACHKQKSTYNCRGCDKDYCFAHLQEHRQRLNEQLDGLINEHDQFRHTVEEQYPNSCLLKQIDQWEQRSMETIRKAAEQGRELVKKLTRVADLIKENLDQFRTQVKYIAEENEFNEIDLQRMTNDLIKMKEKMSKLSNTSIGEDSLALIHKIRLTSSIPEDKQESKSGQWNQQATTVTDRANQRSAKFDLKKNS